MSQGKEEECGRGGEGGGCNLYFLLGVSDDNSKVMQSPPSAVHCTFFSLGLRMKEGKLSSVETSTTGYQNSVIKL